jgi:addiction module HigA family antidote
MESLFRKDLRPTHPGEILKEEFMVPLDMSANRLSLLMRVPSGRITQIINGQRAISIDTALDYLGYLAQRLNSGWVCKTCTTFKWQRMI